MNDEEFKRRIAQRAGGKEDGSLDELMAEKVRLEDTKKKLEIRKKKCWIKIGNMDVDDDLYDTLLRIIWVLYGIDGKAGKIGCRFTAK